MEGTQGFKVTVTFAEVKFTASPKDPVLELRATIKSNSQHIQLRHTGVIMSSSLTIETPMSLQLFLDGQELAEGNIQLGVLCGKTLVGDYDK